MPYAPFFSPYLSLVLLHRFAKWRKTIFKLKFSSINLLMTIAVVAALFDYGSAVVLYSMF
jgi:hypothetical protein